MLAQLRATELSGFSYISRLRPSCVPIGAMPAAAEMGAEDSLRAMVRVLKRCIFVLYIASGRLTKYVPTPRILNHFCGTGVPSLRTCTR